MDFSEMKLSVKKVIEFYQSLFYIHYIYVPSKLHTRNSF